MLGYTHFLKLRNEQETLIPHEMELILSAIDTWNNEDEEQIRCAELLVMPILGSPATIHKNLTLLIKNGFVTQTTQKTDKRVKYLTISKYGEKYLRDMEALFLQCTTKKDKK